ncbi:hypothetical protein CN177_14570 [Sinorhizobium meliloti]|nr:hypothetical protein CN219_21290 [Sinorhizobium meliloti]RVI38424.1 hypothetical protein CN197_04695 [Sinorhizobium meliloti]RVI42178.1 hypothetical protein CN196_22950 [Sinorhizobium meliloti]RVJ25013.1 hypothetical protein CN177_14570 [Sinorhizobium meliloti]RVJ99406.1 hypothetical protein CN170_16190 [Sinorhizobium meliloti]
MTERIARRPLLGQPEQRFSGRAGVVSRKHTDMASVSTETPTSRSSTPTRPRSRSCRPKGVFTYDPGFTSTASIESGITYIGAEFLGSRTLKLAFTKPFGGWHAQSAKHTCGGADVLVGPTAASRVVILALSGREPRPPARFQRRQYPISH